MFIVLTKFISEQLFKFYIIIDEQSAPTSHVMKIILNTVKYIICN